MKFSTNCFSIAKLIAITAVFTAFRLNVAGACKASVETPTAVKVVTYNYWRCVANGGFICRTSTNSVSTCLGSEVLNPSTPFSDNQVCSNYVSWTLCYTFTSSGTTPGTCQPDINLCTAALGKIVVASGFATFTACSSFSTAGFVRCIGIAPSPFSNITNCRPVEAGCRPSVEQQSPNAAQARSSGGLVAVSKTVAECLALSPTILCYNATLRATTASQGFYSTCPLDSVGCPSPTFRIQSSTLFASQTDCQSFQTNKWIRCVDVANGTSCLPYDSSQLVTCSYVASNLTAQPSGFIFQSFAQCQNYSNSTVSGFYQRCVSLQDLVRQCIPQSVACSSLGTSYVSAPVGNSFYGNYAACLADERFISCYTQPEDRFTCQYDFMGCNQIDTSSNSSWAQVPPATDFATLPLCNAYKVGTYKRCIVYSSGRVMCRPSAQSCIPLVNTNGVVNSNQQEYLQSATVFWQNKGNCSATLKYYICYDPANPELSNNCLTDRIGCTNTLTPLRLPDGKIRTWETQVDCTSASLRWHLCTNTGASPPTLACRPEYSHIDPANIVDWFNGISGDSKPHCKDAETDSGVIYANLTACQAAQSG